MGIRLFWQVNHVLPPVGLSRVCLIVCLSVCPSVLLSVCLSLCRPVCLSTCLSACSPACLPTFSCVPFLRSCCWDSTQMALVLNRGLVDAHSNLGNLYKVRSCFAALAPELRGPMLTLAGPCEGCQLPTMLCCGTLSVTTAVSARVRKILVLLSCCCHSARL